MWKKKGGGPSLKDVARAANVSTAAVCYALRNQPGVSKATRTQILRIAGQLNYVPDARITSWMLRMREAKTKQLLPIAWLNSKPGKDDWTRLKYLSPYLEGARARALELGYQLEEIWTHEPGMTMRRISEILYQRGIEGVIVSQPARHIRLDWPQLAGVSIDGALLAPSLHRVMSDNAFNLLLALKWLKRLGHRRIGVCLSEELDSFSQHACHSSALDFYLKTPKAERILPLFYWGPDDTGARVADWLRQNKPRVVVGLDNRLKRWIEKAGYRVPDEVGVVHLALDDDVNDWAGIYSNKREIGATAAEQVISHLQNHRFGLPRIALNTLVRGSWRSGCTLSSPARQLNLK